MTLTRQCQRLLVISTLVAGAAFAQTQRVVPIDVVVFGNSTTSAELDTGIAFANTSWSGSGISFRLGTIRFVTAALLGNIASSTSVTWAQVKGEAAVLGIPADAYLDTASATADGWLKQFSTRFFPAAHVPVFFGAQNNGICVAPLFISDTLVGAQQQAGFSSDPSRGIICVGGGIGPALTVAHELGHYFGLPHIWESDTIAGMQAYYGMGPEWHYDLMMTQSGSTQTFYTSRSKAAEARRDLFPKNRTSNPCTMVSNTSPPGCYRIQSCTVNGVTYPSGAPELAGLEIPIAGGLRAVNMMGYLNLNCPTGTQPDFRLSPSQIDIVAEMSRSATGKRYLLGGPAFARGDFSNDGYGDLVALQGITLTIASPARPGVWVSNTMVNDDFAANYASQSGVKVVSGDFNGDGVGDLAASGGPGWATLPVRRSGPGGLADTASVVVNNASSFNQFSSQTGAKLGAVDLNGDGFSDVFSFGGSGWTSVPYTLSNGNLTWSAPVNTQIGSAASVLSDPAARVVTGDFNGDGFGDIVATNGTIGYSLSFSPATGGFSVGTIVAPGFWQMASQGVGLFAGDFNGDGRTDLATLGQSGATTLPLAISNGPSFDVISLPVDGSFHSLARVAGVRVLTGDYNADGLSDIALVGGSGWTSVPLLLSNGNSSFTFVNPIAPAVNHARFLNARAFSL